MSRLGGVTLASLRAAITRLLSRSMGAYFALADIGLALHFVNHPETLFADSRIYFQATAVWAAGGNPWGPTLGGSGFAAPPPALLLNVPLLPLGESWAVLLWVIADALAVIWLLRRFRLPLYWILFYPISEAFMAASPDLVLAALALAGGGAIAALIKPYSIPTLVSEHRWPAIALAAAMALFTVPLLPWRAFLDMTGSVASTFDVWAVPNSAWGNPLLMVAGAIALILLGRDRGLALLVPCLIGQQPHYAVFSLWAVSRSRLATAGTAMPLRGAAAYGVILYALAERLRTLQSLPGTDRVRRNTLRAADAAREGLG
jgi:hypothetical protein